jgi:hypothetical protein
MLGSPLVPRKQRLRGQFEELVKGSSHQTLTHVFTDSLDIKKLPAALVLSALVPALISTRALPVNSFLKCGFRIWASPHFRTSRRSSLRRGIRWPSGKVSVRRGWAPPTGSRGSSTALRGGKSLAVGICTEKKALRVFGTSVLTAEDLNYRRNDQISMSWERVGERRGRG